MQEFAVICFDAKRRGTLRRRFCRDIKTHEALHRQRFAVRLYAVRELLLGHVKVKAVFKADILRAEIFCAALQPDSRAPALRLALCRLCAGVALAVVAAACRGVIVIADAVIPGERDIAAVRIAVDECQIRRIDEQLFAVDARLDCDGNAAALSCGVLCRCRCDCRPDGLIGAVFADGQCDACRMGCRNTRKQCGSQHKCCRQYS